MEAKEFANKPPMAMPGFTTLTPKSEAETVYDKKIQEEMEKRMMDCCDGYSPHDYNRYGYKPRQQTADSSQQQNAEPQPEIPQTEKKNSKREGTVTQKKESA